MNILGIDPGLDGAMALVRKSRDETQLLATWDMPTVDLPKGRAVDIPRLWDILRLEVWDLSQRKWTTVIEKVRAMPRKVGNKEVKMGAQSSFNFGEGFGILRAAAHAVQGGPVALVEARTWKMRANLLGEPKDAALGRVLSLYPSESMMFTPKRGRLRKTSAIGRADATLIATYGSPYTPSIEDLF